MGEQGKWDIRLSEMGQGKSREGPFPKQRGALEVLMISKSSGVLNHLLPPVQLGHYEFRLYLGHPGCRPFKYPKGP